MKTYLLEIIALLLIPMFLMSSERIESIDVDRDWVKDSIFITLKNGTKWKVLDDSCLELVNIDRGDEVEIFISPMGYVNGQRSLFSQRKNYSIEVKRCKSAK